MNRAYVVLLVAAVAFLSFVAGVGAQQFGLLPYDYLRQAFAAARAYQKWYAARREGYPRFLWSEEREPTIAEPRRMSVLADNRPRRFVRPAGKGVTRYAKGEAYEGLTLLTSGHAQAAFLIDMEGRVVHEWRFAFRDVWPDPPHVGWPVPAYRTYYQRARVEPNGDLLAIFQADGGTPWGYGLIKLDKSSKLIWSYPERVHHDLDVGPDGRIYTLVHRIRTDAERAVPEVLPPFLDDSIAILSPEGQELSRINILRAFVGSQYESTLGFIRDPADPMHANTIKVVDERIASRHPYARAGQLLVSMRNIDTLAVVDPGSGSVVWALRGPWSVQHDPDFLDNGHLLLFDNLGQLGRRQSSRVIEVDPLTQRIHWEYAGSDAERFFSYWRSQQQRLPNGNTLIVESETGRVFEVTRDRRIVWEYVNPIRGGEREQYIPVITGAQRLPREALPFVGR